MPMAERFVIHIDLDWFYGQVEARLDASLREVPFAVQQKHIVVTCNYLARARGVRKLQLLTDARRLCPELVIVNGEDIEKYRLASKSVFDFICQQLGPRVQRLGLDEVWCDITADLHKVLPGLTATNIRDMQVTVGSLRCDINPRPSGALLGEYDPQSPVHRGLCIASHVAAALRQGIVEQCGFTSSAGISTSKIFSKLVGAEHKPDAQTTILPEAHYRYVGGVAMNKIPGVGVVILQRLLAELVREPPLHPRSVEVEVAAGHRLRSSAEDCSPDSRSQSPDASCHDDESSSSSSSYPKEELLVTNRSSLLVAHVRKRVDLEQLIAWFGDERGRWLDDIIRAKDTSEVVASATLPSVVSIEDSFVHCAARDEVAQRLTGLGLDLLRRLENDLMGKAADWLVYARTVRLTARFRDVMVQGSLWKHKRFSKSARCPVELFDLHCLPAARAELLVRQSLMPLFDAMVRTRPGWVLSLLNVAVTDFHDERPGASIKSFLLGAKRRRGSPLEETKSTRQQNNTASVDRDRDSGEPSTRKDDIGSASVSDHASKDADEYTDESSLVECQYCTACRSMIPIFAYGSHVCIPGVATCNDQSTDDQRPRSRSMA